MNKIKEKLVYVIDDDEVMRIACKQILDLEGYEVKIFENGREGIDQTIMQKPELIIVDLKMPQISGMDVIQKVHELDPNIVIIVITGFATIDTAVEAMKAGAYDFLPKPFTPDELRIIVRRGLEKQHLVEEANRLKQEKEKMQRQFVTFVSHQLQSPLVAVQQYLDVLKDIKDSPEKDKIQQEWLQKSSKKIHGLLDLINDWLTISRIESGCLADHFKKVNIVLLLQDIIQTYEKRAKDNHITMQLETTKEECTVIGSDECLEVVFSNLVVNAIKYNKPNGKITISVNEHPNDVTVVIADTGIGIDKQNIDSIFEEFHRVKSDTTKHISGTGLGLPICKKIVTELGGSISIESELDKGSTFRITLQKTKAV